MNNNDINIEAQIFASGIVQQFGQASYADINKKSVKLTELFLEAQFMPGEIPTMEQLCAAQADCSHLIAIVCKKEADIAGKIAKFYYKSDIDEVGRLGHFAALHKVWNDNEARRAQLARRSLIIEEAIELMVEIHANRMFKSQMNQE